MPRKQVAVGDAGKESTGAFSLSHTTFLVTSTNDRRTPCKAVRRRFNDFKTLAESIGRRFPGAVGPAEIGGDVLPRRGHKRKHRRASRDSPPLASRGTLPPAQVISDPSESWERNTARRGRRLNAFIDQVADHRHVS